MIDKQRNIDILNLSAILRPKFPGSIIRDHKFSSISGDVIVNAFFECLKQRRFSMITAAGNQRNPFSDTHTCDRTTMSKLYGDFHALWGLKRDGILHRQIRISALSWQNRTICHKCDQTSFL